VVAAVLEALGGIAIDQGYNAAAVSLISKASAIRAELDVPVRPLWQPRLDRALAHLQSALDARAFAAAWQRGKGLDLDGIVASAATGRLMAFAAGVEEPVTAAPHRAMSRAQEEHPHGLTGRELEVLRLLTGGHSNREVGEKLYISPATAARHVANIYNKLGVDSRARATAFAFQHGLA
jgi:DNA-binding NarL/FixJ family response regulator